MDALVDVEIRQVSLVSSHVVPRRPPALLADGVGRTLVVLAALLLVASPLGYRLGLVPLEIALLYLVPGGMLMAVLSLLLISFALLVRAWAESPNLGFAPAAAGIALSLVCVAVPGVQIVKAFWLPPIHDITTDTELVPPFVALAAQRRAAPNGIAYGGARVARQQLDAYPEVRTLHSRLGERELFALAQRLATDAGWQIVAAEPSQGRIEATATTLLFGFKDDIVVRVWPEGGGSRIDLRSASRIGEGDLGANAARIRALLEKLRAAGA
jgi:uncharacterized protein (DUF1499 family)